MTCASSHDAVQAPAGSASFLAGSGEMAALIRAKDWSKTPLGPIDQWPQSLRTTVSLCLASDVPIDIIWGPAHTQIYNDGYRRICGQAHPSALGQDYSVTWASAWPVIGEPFEHACAGGTSHLENQRMFVRRNGYLEETFFTLSISPIRDESGGIGGLFHPLTETTANMLSERRTRALCEVNAALGEATDQDQLASLTVSVLAAFPLDLPFLLYYELTPDGSSYTLAAWHGLDASGAAAPATLASDATMPWPIASALEARSPVKCAGIAPLFARTPCGPYDEPPDAGFLLPVRVAGVDRPVAVVVAGASPRLPLNDAYRGYFEELMSAISVGVDTVRSGKDARHRAEALAQIDRTKALLFSRVSRRLRRPPVPGSPGASSAAGDTLAPDERERTGRARGLGTRMLKRGDAPADDPRIEAGRTHACHQPADLRAYTAELASSLRATAERVGLWLDMDLPLPHPVAIERAMWDRIVLNLLSNAVEFTFDEAVEEVVRPPADVRAAGPTISDPDRGVVDALSGPRLRAIFQSSYQHQVIVALDGSVLDANAASLSGIGGQLRDVVGRPLWKTPWFERTPGMPEAVRQGIAQAVAGQSVRHEIRLDLPVGGWRSFDATLRPIVDHHGTTVALIHEAVDITERRKAEDALRQTQKIEAIGQLTGGVAHDFNNLLMVLAGGLSMLDREIEPARHERILDGMRKAVDRGTRLTRQLLAFSRRQPLNPTSVDLGKLLEGMRELLDRTLRGDVQVKAEFPADLWCCHADPVELELALLNLCANARDAMPEGGVIRLRAGNLPGNSSPDATGDRVWLEVVDSGTGMPSQVVSRVFEPFFTTKEIGKGSGLGLPQVSGFAKGSGGSVQVQSEVDQGTTITLLLPRANIAGDGQATTPPAAIAERQSHNSVLLVEDDDEVAALVTEMLHSLGYGVTRAATAQAALGALANDRVVDLVLSDVIMPGGMSGLELAREVRRRWAGIPVVLTSGFAEAVRRDVQADGFTLLAKPYDLRDLSETLHQAGQSRGELHRGE